MEPPISPMMTMPGIRIRTGTATVDLTDAVFTFSVGIFEENLDEIYVLSTRKWIPSDTDTKRLTHSGIGSLSDCLVC
jgi:hypothetical protein